MVTKICPYCGKLHEVDKPIEQEGGSENETATIIASIGFIVTFLFCCCAYLVISVTPASNEEEYDPFKPPESTSEPLAATPKRREYQRTLAAEKLNTDPRYGDLSNL